jgi:hypothetical protein
VCQWAQQVSYDLPMAKTKAQIAANKHFIREQLGEDPSKWSTSCVLPYPEKFERSIDLLHQAALAAASGVAGIEQAKHLIGQMDDWEMRTWFDDYAQNSGKVRLEISGTKHISKSGGGSLVRPSKKHQLAIIKAQGFHCRYCGIRIVPRDQFLKLQKLVGYVTLPNRSQKLGKMKNTDIHGIWLLTRATVDHIEPMSQGGIDVNREENLAACCWPCNYAKWKYTVEELGLENPNLRPPTSNQWLGLTDILL